MLNEDDRFALVNLLQEYSLKEVVLELSKIASDRADEFVDMQITDKSQDFSLGSELLLRVAKFLE